MVRVIGEQCTQRVSALQPVVARNIGNVGDDDIMVDFADQVPERFLCHHCKILTGELHQTSAGVRFCSKCLVLFPPANLGSLIVPASSFSRYFNGPALGTVPTKSKCIAPTTTVTTTTPDCVMITTQSCSSVVSICEPKRAMDSNQHLRPAGLPKPLVCDLMEKGNSSKIETIQVLQSVCDLKAFCPWKSRGCLYMDTFQSVLVHYKYCENYPVPCYQCNSMINQGDLAKHLETECSMRCTFCTHCKEEYKISEKNDHYLVCKKWPIHCQYCSERRRSRHEVQFHEDMCDPKETTAKNLTPESELKEKKDGTEVCPGKEETEDVQHASS